MTKTYESICTEYAAFGATEDDFMDAADNALILLQDEYGYNAVTAETLLESGKFYSEWLGLVEDSLEGVRSEGRLGRRR